MLSSMILQRVKYNISIICKKLIANKTIIIVTGETWSIKIRPNGNFKSKE